jgi:isopentenyl diphosphate isomerase/L-lactate dehydrogenase-like FMN-dependent dehydrogenase
MIELISSQIDISLAQLGCTDIDDIDSSYVIDDRLQEKQ